MQGEDVRSGAEIGLFEAIYTQRAIRSFRPDPVPEAAIRTVIEAATKAPNGANAQPWAFIVVTDEDKRAALAALAREGFAPRYERALSRRQPGDPPPMARLKRMMDDFESIPAHVVVCYTHPADRPHEPADKAQIFPAVQNLLLAARGLGLGSVLTTGWAQPVMPRIRELLRLPEHVEPMAFLPLGYPDRERYGPTSRRPVDEVTHWQGWEGDKGYTAKTTYRR